MDRLLISTKNYLAYFDGKQLHRIHEGAYFYYGISQFGTDDILVAATSEDLHSELLRFSSSLSLKTPYLSLGKCDVHQILCYGRKLLVCNTWHDAIDVFDGTIRSEQWRPFPTINELHVNSINAVDGLLHVSAHNKSLRPGEVYVMEPDFNPRGVIEVGHDIHNVWAQGDALMVLATTETCIIRLLKGRRETIRLRPAGWLRGVAASAARTYVGLSSLATRAKRHVGPAEILVYESAQLRKGCRPEPVDVISLPDAGQVYEVRLIGVPDAGHAGKTMTVVA